MNVAVLTFTRDRLDYTKHCFNTLQQNAGCPYDHYVLDQGSTDGTIGWLGEWMRDGNSGHGHGRHILFSKTNIGICAAANRLLELLEPARYDVIVRYDNDCEVTQTDTLQVCADLAHRFGAIVSPTIQGLINPPPTIRTVSLGGHLLDEKQIMGGIFMAIPAFLFDECGFRYDERHALGTGDEAIVPWARQLGGVCGYLQDISVTHYETTEGQKARFPEYQARKELELAS